MINILYSFNHHFNQLSDLNQLLKNILPTTPKRSNSPQSNNLGLISPNTPHFPSSFPVFSYQSPPLPPHRNQKYPKHFSNTKSSYFWPSLPIGTLEKVDAVLLGACEMVEEEVKKNLESLEDGLVDQSSELGDNEVYLHQNLQSEDDSTKDDWLEEDSDIEEFDNTEADTAINASSNWAKEKLVRIFHGDVVIPQ